MSSTSEKMLPDAHIPGLGEPVASYTVKTLSGTVVDIDDFGGGAVAGGTRGFWIDQRPGAPSQDAQFARIEFDARMAVEQARLVSLERDRQEQARQDALERSERTKAAGEARAERWQKTFNAIWAALLCVHEGKEPGWYKDVVARWWPDDQGAPPKGKVLARLHGARSPIALLPGESDALLDVFPESNPGVTRLTDAAAAARVKPVICRMLDRSS